VERRYRLTLDERETAALAVLTPVTGRKKAAKIAAN
jgi:hypothetical protein